VLRITSSEVISQKMFFRKKNENILSISKEKGEKT
jgi:hypothetical protein